MGIKNWPKSHRPRERLLEHGAAALTDGEILALFLGSGRDGETAVDTAQRMIDKFGSLASLMSADGDDLLAQPGIGPARYALLMAALELSRRCPVRGSNAQGPIATLQRPGFSWQKIHPLYAEGLPGPRGLDGEERLQAEQGIMRSHAWNIGQEWIRGIKLSKKTFGKE